MTQSTSPLYLYLLGWTLHDRYEWFILGEQVNKMRKTISPFIFAVLLTGVFFFISIPLMGVEPSLGSASNSQINHNQENIGAAMPFSAPPPIIENWSSIFGGVLDEQASSANWTVLVYLDGDNDLEEYAFIDLNAMELVGSTADVRIIVLVDFWSGTDAPYSGSRCYEITFDDNMNSINSLILTTPLPSEPNMGDSVTLRDFICFGQAYAPAEHYLLVLWDHGTGYLGLCSDDTSDDYLTIRELEQALADPTVQPLDIVAFDACLMGQLEVGYELRDVTELLVFSEEGIPLNGFPYDDILLNLTTFPETNPFTLASSMIYYYTTAYDIGGQYYDPLVDYVCLSVVNTSYCTSVAFALDQLSDELLFNLYRPDVFELVCAARRFTQGFTRADFMDLGGFASQLETTFSTPGMFSDLLRSYAQNLSASIDSAICEEMHLAGIPGATGVSITFGNYELAQLDLADDISWDEFMEAFTDIGASFDVAFPLNDTGEHYGYLDGYDDSFYFLYQPSTSGTYRISIDAVWDEYVTDFDLYIYDANKNELASSLSWDSYESISLYLDAGNVYYIEVYSYPGDNSGIGVFQIALQLLGGPTIPINLGLLGFVIGVISLTIIVVVAIAIYLTRRRLDITTPPPHYPTLPYSPTTPSQGKGAVRFCAYCGAMIPIHARYCPVCGTSTSRD